MNHEKNSFSLLFRKYFNAVNFLLLLILIASIAYGLLWLFLCVLFLIITYSFGDYLIKKIKLQIIQKISSILFLFLGVFVIGLIVKTLIIDLYRISSYSMKDTLFSKDLILVSKLNYGPKLPRSPYEISWANLFFYLNNSNKKAKSDNWWSYYRLSGFENIKQGDVVVYQTSRIDNIIKRCVATSGDTLAIRNGELFVNRKLYNGPETIKNNYILKVLNITSFYTQIDSLDLNSPIFKNKSERNILYGNFSLRDSKLIGNLSSVLSIEKTIDNYNASNNLFANPKNSMWSIDNIDPIVVPQKKMKIEINEYTFELYKKTIRDYEGLELKEFEGDYYLNGIVVTEYIFLKDYYFLVGDNRKYSGDSRHFGFIPEDFIVGKGSYIVFSTNKHLRDDNLFIRELK